MKRQGGRYCGRSSESPAPRSTQGRLAERKSCSRPYPKSRTLCSRPTGGEFTPAGSDYRHKGAFIDHDLGWVSAQRLHVATREPLLEISISMPMPIALQTHQLTATPCNVSERGGRRGTGLYALRIGLSSREPED